MYTESFVIRGFLVCFLEAGLLGDVSGEGLSRIFISFPGVSFNMLMHQNENIGHSLVSVTFKECHQRGTASSLPQQGLECIR